MTEKIKQTGNWFRLNIVGIIISVLLGVITFGGREGILIIKHTFEQQSKLNEKQQELNNVFIENSFRLNEQCNTFNEKFQILNEVNMNHGIKILENREKLIIHETEIQNLKKR
jgi:hypothetical protein